MTLSCRLANRAFLKSSTLRTSSKQLSKAESVDSSKANNNSLLNKVVLKPVATTAQSALQSRFTTCNSGKSENVYANEPEGKSSSPFGGPPADRNSLIELSRSLDQLIEGQVKALNGDSDAPESIQQKVSPSRGGVGSKQLVERVHQLRKMCIAVSEDAFTPQGRFRIRELLTKLEKNSDRLRSSSGGPSDGGNGQQLVSLYADLQANIRDIITVVQKS